MPNPNIDQPLPWITEAFNYKGMREIVGIRHNSNIIKWLINLGAWWRDDETPWCGTFVAHCLTTTKRAIPTFWMRAKAYASNGTVLSQPAYGCLGVMSRKGGGHVCFIIGQTSDNRLVVIGGNQNNAVSVASYPRSRFDAFVWPSRGNGVPSLPYSYRYDLPRYARGDYTQPKSEA